MLKDLLEGRTRERERESRAQKREREPRAKMATVCRHDLGIGPNKRRVPALARHLARTRDEHSSLQPQSAPRTVQNGARGDECRPEREWPPSVTTTMELDETKGACQLYSWQVAHVRFISDHGSTRNDDGLNGVRGGECWPNPNDMHTTSTDHNGRPSTESRTHAQER